MKVLAVGGGSGGHVTPVVAVLRELKRKEQDVVIRFWCDKKFGPQARSIVDSFDASIPIATIHAGKLRRYHTLTFLQQLRRFRTIFLPNVRDMFLVLVGFIESVIRLVIWRPDVIFTKGGFVCLPVGIAAKALRIPLVIHDSDAHPGLTNRILSRWASMIATGAPLHHYSYPKEKSYYAGIPIAPEFKPFSDQERAEAKIAIGFDSSRDLLVVTGGGLGAKRLNDAVMTVLNELLDITSVLLISGTGQYDELRDRSPQSDPRFQLRAFISEGMAQVLGASDVVLTRAGATTIVELAALAKATILVPNAYLTGGHQLKNAAVYAEDGSVLVLDEAYLEDNPLALTTAVSALLSDKGKLFEMQQRFHAFSKPNAASDVADMIIGAVKKA